MPRKAKEVKPVVKKTKAITKEELVTLALDALQEIVIALDKRIFELEQRESGCSCKNK